VLAISQGLAFIITAMGNFRTERRTTARTAGNHILPIAYVCRFFEEVFQVWNVFEIQFRDIETDVIEYDKVLMNLAHIAYMRDDRYAMLARKQANANELAHAGHSRTVNLAVLEPTQLKIILERN